MLKDQYFEAAVEYRAAVNEDSTDVYAVVNRGLAWLHLQDFEMAQADFEAAMKLDPRNWFTFLGRGFVHEKRNHFEQARADYQEAHRLLGDANHPQREEILSGLIRCSIALGDASGGLTVADEFLRDFPEGPAGYSIRGQARVGLCLFEDAIADFSEAMQRGLRSSYLLRYRAHAYERIGNVSCAIADLKEAALLEPGDFELQAYLGFSLTQGGQWTEARSHFERLLAEHPDDPLIMNNLAWMLATCPDAAFRDGPLAVRLATKACELSQGTVAHYVGTLGAAFAEVGEFDRAVECSMRALSKFEGTERQECQRILEHYQSRKPYRDVLSKSRRAP
ncbi:bacteriophage N4 receptor, outer membrane subunit [Caulifigura coniformis]|uniref:Bacteriophage N4 receptor, outer membrane subunit n=2 Tax=Caulifigura coniformis TaxID=2527983 RepID=A0A517SE49_9PLAN|nr:bacteriophage N4 receptor, outer membrane subunit [Caulifigura coniformis]